MHEPEAEVQQQIRLAAARYGFILWRNNSGVMPGRVLEDGTVTRPVRFGLGNDSKKINDIIKSSDLIGFGPAGCITAVECKHSGWKGVSTKREQAQQNFLNKINQGGGIGIFARSVQDYITAIETRIQLLAQKIPGHQG